ncbi:hypothetical protein QRO11_15590 [Paracidovorax citrulli]|uniref:Uncharacterized protein n=2 Tax=Paracidovorax citrulli TaxID=80869 RepID=A1TMR8_PARC0|nr:hypothetical protein [Paracidovorax citrulli]ABM32256.1 hypothetical protein Aave_1669 [Paracidovorax citrulli AAC00-1]MVT38531.1 hypothetical protein [Paracidovorax citrulli]PVY66453.1 hypothetical protein C8E08_3861 [Paracidovorax citrulli]QCX12130.1 hypothetical protein APS58_3368 [Paracidovorax citrulli]REG69377.1 hypothetical protein C8E07_2525 [Paracidovorax citrulli]
MNMESHITPQDAPMGTKAPSIGGGYWCKTPKGWKWGGPGGNGSTLPHPGGDWDGRLLPPSGTLPAQRTPQPPADRQACAKALAAGLQMPSAKALEIIRYVSWDRSYSVCNLDALELVREVERYYGRTEGGAA